MSPVLFFYLADVLPSFGKLCGFLGMLSVIISVALLVFYIDAKVKGDEKCANAFKAPKNLSLGILAFFFFVANIIPSKDAIYLMAASSVVMDVAKNERVKSIADGSLSMIEDKIKEYKAQKGVK